MDLSTIIGIVSGIILIVISILLGGSLLAFFDAASVMIVVGGTIAATLVAFPIPQVKDIIKLTQKTFANRDSNPGKIINDIITLANAATITTAIAITKEGSSLEVTANAEQIPNT